MQVTLSGEDDHALLSAEIRQDTQVVRTGQKDTGSGQEDVTRDWERGLESRERLAFRLVCPSGRSATSPSSSYSSSSHDAEEHVIYCAAALIVRNHEDRAAANPRHE